MRCRDRVMSKQSSGVSLLLFVLSPLVGFLSTFRDITSRASGFIFVTFYTLFGYFHTFEDIRSDSYRKAIDFETGSLGSLSDVWRDYMNGDITDIYEKLLYHILHLFTRDPHILMAVVGMIGGYFVWKTISRVLQDWDSEESNLPICAIVLMLFLCFNPVMIGGVRNFTAVAIFSYSTLRFLVDRRSWWVVGLLLSPLIHFGFVVSAAAVIFARFVRLPNKFLLYLLIPIAIFSTFFTNTSMWKDVVVDIVDTAEYNEAIATRAESYVDDDNDMEFESSLTTRLMTIQNRVSVLYLLLLLLWLNRKEHYLVGDEHTERLYNLMLFFLLFGYMFVGFSVVGQRYLFLGQMLMYMCLVNLYKFNPTSAVRRFVLLFPVMHLITIAWIIFNSWFNVEPLLFITPLPVLFAIG